MFKNTQKNCFKPVLYGNAVDTTITSTTATTATTATAAVGICEPPETHKCCNGPFLSYYNHFSLPTVSMINDKTEYIPLPLKIVTSNDSNDNIPVYVSSSVYTHLCNIKQQIEKYQDAWDNIKKFTNPYEYIHTNISGNKTNISKLRPLSRSFYKMIEIIKTHNILSKYTHTIYHKPDVRMGIQTFHLAEGPGGFIEAIAYLRGLDYHECKEQPLTPTSHSMPVQILKRNTELHDEVMKELEHLKLSRRIFESENTSTSCGTDSTTTTHIYGNDRYYGITLINDDPICPGWKKTRTFLENHPNVIIETGADKTGNLISYENFQYCATKYRNKMEIITADGGFDFSVDFNNQETMAMRLILCEVFYALALQKKGGTFILKIFDVFHKPTVDILYMLCYYYQNVSIMKPHTSRIANSEKYVVCQGFKVTDSSQLIEQFSSIFSLLEQGRAGIRESMQILSILPEEHDLYFLNKIEEMNAMVSFQQIENITSTLSIITNNRNIEKLDQYKKTNINKCVAWCETYNIPYNIHHHTIQSTNIFLHRTAPVAPVPSAVGI